MVIVLPAAPSPVVFFTLQPFPPPSLSPSLFSPQAFLSREVELKQCVGELCAQLEQMDIEYRKKEWSHADALQEKQLLCQR